MELKLIYDKLYRYVYFKLRNREVAEDITQETFLRYIRQKGGTYGYEIKYLYTIARNLCIDEYRKIKEDSLPESYEATIDSFEDKTINQMAIQKALGELDKDMQELLLLRYVNEESVSTISKLYNCSRFAVYRKLSIAEKELKRVLEGSGNEH